VDGRVASAADTPAAGSEIVVEDETPAPSTGARPALQVVIEDDRRVVVFKPAGLHCERGKSAGNIADLLEQRYGDLSRVGDRPEEAGLVHRIDRDTSGVVIAALDRREYRRLRQLFRSGAATKHYLALAAGRLRKPVEIDLALTRRAGRMVPAGRHEEGRPALTRFEPLDGAADWSLVLATMRTGVMHQVRVHMAAAGHPLFGDSLYGGPALAGCPRHGQLLHALRIEAGGDIDVTVGPPEDFLAAYARLRR
jgi:23S rRNA pseudouridine1911/1915/1917 synthase